uniref:Cytochrome P450 n=1 Tax=Anopheles farauti TaxID=69004 RepID=A0A182Q6G4_9DIPT
MMFEQKTSQIFADNLFDIAEKNSSLTEEHIQDHIDTMIAAGHDTTATTMSNLLLMLAIHPEVQETVYQEVMSVCPDKTKPITMEEANKLVYTEMVCKETMRLFPKNTPFQREAPCALESTLYTVSRLYGDPIRRSSIPITSYRIEWQHATRTHICRSVEDLEIASEFDMLGCR